MDYVALLQEGLALDEQVKALTARLRQIKADLAPVAAFKPGSSTGFVIAGGYRAKVVTGITRTFDQDKLLPVRESFPEAFPTLFKAVYEPTAKRAIDQALAAGGELADALRWAMEEKPKTPSVTFERLEEGEVADAA